MKLKVYLYTQTIKPFKIHSSRRAFLGGLGGGGKKVCARNSMPMPVTMKRGIPYMRVDPRADGITYTE